MLSRFLSGRRAPAPIFLEVEEVNGLDRAVAGVAVVRDVLGVAANFFVAVGLLVLCRDRVEGWTVVRRPGAAVAVFEDEVRSELVDGASDILFGLADMPSLLFSSPDGLSSTELADCLFWWDAVVGVEVVPGVLRTVVVVGLAGGLLREPPTAGLAVEEAVVPGRAPVESLGAVGLVTGLEAGRGFLLLEGAGSSAVLPRLSMMSYDGDTRRRMQRKKKSGRNENSIRDK